MFDNKLNRIHKASSAEMESTQLPKFARKLLVNKFEWTPAPQLAFAQKTRKSFLSPSTVRSQPAKPGGKKGRLQIVSTLIYLYTRWACATNATASMAETIWRQTASTLVRDLPTQKANAKLAITTTIKN